MQNLPLVALGSVVVDSVGMVIFMKLSRRVLLWLGSIAMVSFAVASIVMVTQYCCGKCCHGECCCHGE